MLKMIDEKGRKKELSELRNIFKRNLTEHEYRWGLRWYQNIRPALKTGLIRCDYKITWRNISDKVRADNLEKEVQEWLSKKNPNRIYSDYLCFSRNGLALRYNYKQA